MILVAWEDEMLIDFIGDDRHEMTFGDLKDVQDVLFAKDASTGIRRIRDDNRHCVLVDERCHVIQIDFPILLRN